MESIRKKMEGKKTEWEGTRTRIKNEATLFKIEILKQIYTFYLVKVAQVYSH